MNTEILESKTFSIYHWLGSPSRIFTLSTVFLSYPLIISCLYTLLMTFALFPRQIPESPVSSPTKKNIVRPDYEHQIYNIYTKSGQSLYNVTYLKGLPLILSTPLCWILQRHYTTFHWLELTLATSLGLLLTFGWKRHSHTMMCALLCKYFRWMRFVCFRKSHWPPPPCRPVFQVQNITLSLGCEDMLVCFFFFWLERDTMWWGWANL